ncbi:hypothetical protein [Halobacteriovorax sp. JY17]|uniref:hypothetical protein n=1 Tax=Halobacteriovorax sp. JY17 TaxID=2014617 RepID=UPI000C4FCAA3|nr:hypothetical protein [Halobacteriovorax sp. JY17]PIK15192.1 MAG: hypothetical protein CES88_00335 [Halobacteriovorax sp. JY17]
MFLSKISTLVMILTLSTPSWASIEGEFSYEKFLRLNSPQKKSKAVDWIGLGAIYKDKTRDTEVFGEANLRYYFNGPQSLNYSLPELYYTSETDDSTWTYGRKIVNWSLNEKYWLLGNLNGRQGFTLLSSKQEGLTGLHYTKEVTKEIDLGIFFSYFHIPALNPGIRIEGGKVTSNSEWVRRPPERTTILGSTVPIEYRMNEPSIGDIVLKKSLGINAAYKWKSGAISSYAIYKPENNLRSNAEASLATDGSKVIAIANPIVNHHLMYGLQGKQYFGDVLGVVSFDVTDPNAKLGDDFEVLNPLQLKDNDRIFESEYFSIKPNYDKESYLSASASVDRESYILSLNYIHLMSNNSRGSDDFFSETVKWKSTIGAMGRIMWTEGIFTLLDYRYDFVRKDQIVRIEGDYIIANAFSLRVGAELIKSPDNTSYWSAYRTNDTIYTSINYLF